jgi:elongation factor G
VVPTERIRNVLVLGHTGTGKSTLVEAMLQAAGLGSGHGTERSVVDHEPEERARGRSLSLSVVTFDFDGHRINVLDAPGGAEAIGDAYPALLAADCALFVVDATVGIQPQHVELWRACEVQGLPRVLFLNKLDLERARYQACVDDLRERYGRPLAPVHMPTGIHEEFDGIIDLLHDTAVEEHDGERVEGPVPETRRDQAARNRERLVEAVVENDDQLLERYLDGQQPSAAELADLFAHGVAACGFFPVLCGSAATGVGVHLLLRFLLEECPSPAEAPHPLPHDGPTVAYVAKTFSDQFVGRINVLRLLSGHLDPDDELVDLRTGDRHRLHHLFTLRGREQQPVDGVAAGDVVAVAKLGEVATGDLLAASPDQVELADLAIPTPPEGFHRVLLEPASVGDDAKLSTVLPRVLDEDPTIRVTYDADAGTRVLTFLGPTHAEITAERIARKHGVEVRLEPAPIAYRETIRAVASATGRHVKQSGGHGQYGVVSIDIAPLPRDDGFSFENGSVGGVVPRAFVPSVEKGVRAAMRTGPLLGAPVVDVAVRLTDGKHHSVDSSDWAFQVAGSLAFREAVAAASPVLLEPICAVRVTVPEELTGTVLADLSARRGRILGTDAARPGWSRVDAQVPEAELTTFTADFRALTSARGEVHVSYDHHDEVPDAVARRLLDGQPET